MIGLLTSLVPGLFKIGDKLIEDKDKKAEYTFKVQEMFFKQMEVLIAAKTYPWVDALVKLAYASEQIVKGLFRPIGAAIMTGFVIYAEIKGIELSGAVETILISAFPAWGASRHQTKKEKIKKQIIDDEDW